MPYGAFGFTVTAAPLAPLPCDAAGAELEADGAGELGVDGAELMPGGTEVVSDPSRTSTWPAATEELAAADTPLKYPAIFAALAAAPVPYSTWVDDRAAMLPTLPALNPAEVTACDNCPARPGVFPPLYTSTVVAPGASDAGCAGFPAGCFAAGPPAAGDG
jgi:hypothetical protein